MVRFRFPTAVWLFLAAATLLSYASWNTGSLADARVAGGAVVVIAMAKAWLIGMRFMELDEAVWPLRMIFNLWIMTVGGMLLTMFWLTP